MEYHRFIWSPLAPLSGAIPLLPTPEKLLLWIWCLIFPCRGTCVAQSVEHLTFNFGSGHHNPRVLESSPIQHGARLGFSLSSPLSSLSLPLPLPPSLLLLMLSFSFSLEMNKKIHLCFMLLLHDYISVFNNISCKWPHTMCIILQPFVFNSIFLSLNYVIAFMYSVSFRHVIIMCSYTNIRTYLFLIDGYFVGFNF